MKHCCHGRKRRMLQEDEYHDDPWKDQVNEGDKQKVIRVMTRKKENEERKRKRRKGVAKRKAMMTLERKRRK